MNLRALQQVADVAGDVAGAGDVAEGAAQAGERAPGLPQRRPRTALPKTAGLPGASGHVRHQQRPLRLLRHLLRHLPRALPRVSRQWHRAPSASAGAAGSKQPLRSLRWTSLAGGSRPLRVDGRLARLLLLLAQAGVAVGSPLPVRLLPRRLPSPGGQTPGRGLRVAKLRRCLQQAGVCKGAAPAAAQCQQPRQGLQASSRLLQRRLLL